MIRIAKPGDIGPVLRDLRAMYRLTQVQLADDAGVCHSQISHWERSERHPDLASLAKVVAALGYDLALLPSIETTSETAPSAHVAADHPLSGLPVRAEGAEAISGALKGERASWISGYDRAVAVLRGVAARSGSDAARWAADYLAADPDRWRQNECCWHGEECPGSGPDCAPKAHPEMIITGWGKA